MFNLSEIMQAAQGGQGITNLANQFGLSPEQAQAAVQALMPGMSMGLQGQATNPISLSSLFGMMTGGAHQEAFHNPLATAAPQTSDAGTEVLHQIFGGPAGAQAIAQHAASVSGLSSSVMQSMMPVIASMIMGGLFKSASTNGLGGLLSAFTGGGAGGLGNAGGLAGMVTQALSGMVSYGNTAVPGNPGAAAAQGGVLGGLIGTLMNNAGTQQAGAGGMLGNLLGGLMGGHAPGQAQQGSTVPNAANPMAAGLEMLQSIMNHGQQVQAGHTNALQDIFNTMVKR